MPGSTSTARMNAAPISSDLKPLPPRTLAEVRDQVAQEIAVQMVNKAGSNARPRQARLEMDNKCRSKRTLKTSANRIRASTDISIFKSDDRGI
ncbi:hypothetical protein C8J55DRAFT_23384 [Lentinula edodes]|uniref:Uncharacterized protein n=1 Tax=Lentinula lateritia TaxID=40482 RepID=A0A9W9APF7_9AGAR|nr:hypothetical protein C8J55DRAFT_23384 [Lentinula edodes]